MAKGEVVKQEKSQAEIDADIDRTTRALIAGLGRPSVFSGRDNIVPRRLSLDTVGRLLAAAGLIVRRDGV